MPLGSSRRMSDAGDRGCHGDPGESPYQVLETVMQFLGHHVRRATVLRGTEPPASCSGTTRKPVRNGPDLGDEEPQAFEAATGMFIISALASSMAGHLPLPLDGQAHLRQQGCMLGNCRIRSVDIAVGVRVGKFIKARADIAQGDGWYPDMCAAPLKHAGSGAGKHVPGNGVVAPFQIGQQKAGTLLVRVIAMVEDMQWLSRSAFDKASVQALEEPDVHAADGRDCHDRLPRASTAGRISTYMRTRRFAAALRPPRPALRKMPMPLS